MQNFHRHKILFVILLLTKKKIFYCCSYRTMSNKLAKTRRQLLEVSCLQKKKFNLKLGS